MSADDSHMLTRARGVTAEEYAAQVGLARGALSVAPVALKARETRTAPVTQPPHRSGRRRPLRTVGVAQTGWSVRRD